MKVVLVGNPNCGKTTLFNRLTRMNQKIGNWPGVTIEKKEGKYHNDKEIDIIDLPGVYSLNPISEDEKITCNYLKENKIDAIINVVDSTNLERNLVLTLQLLEKDVPVIVAMNMQDELKLNGLMLDIEKIEKELKVPTVLISALKNQNIDLLMKKTKDAAQLKILSHKFINSKSTEEERAEYRHNFINDRIESFRIKSDSKIKRITDKIDKIVTNKWLAFPIFVCVIFLMYFISIQSIGALSISAMEWVFDDFVGQNLQSWLVGLEVSPWIVSLLVDGIVGGVGAVLTFVPQILILFLFITFLESCGYMARVAVIMDRIFKRFGLSGKSFIPMIVGCGCSVPAIMSAKTIEGEWEKKATIILTPFIPCSAKLPVFALIAGALFPNNPFVAPSMYFLGIFMVIIGGLFLKLFSKNKYRNEMFLMELPHYRLPKIKNMLKELWDKIKGFVVKAGTIIIPAAIVLWFLESLNFKMQMCDIEDSMLAYIGSSIAWIFAPLGFGNWQSSIALITGFFAKETVIATFGVLLGSEAEMSVALNQLFTPQAAYAFMAFILLSAPCVAAIAATKKEMGGTKGMAIAVAFQCLVAYIVALIINQLGNFYSHNRSAFITLLIAAAVFGIALLCIVRIIKSRKNGGCGCSCGGCSKSNNCPKSND